jgi:hypothetical protein
MPRAIGRVAAVVMIPLATGCPSPPPPPRTATVKPALDGTVGVRDPTHRAAKLVPAPLELVSEVPVTPARFKGSLEIAHPSFSTLIPGQTRAADFFVKASSTGKVPAGIHAIRVAGFEGVAVGIERSFFIQQTPLELAGSLALGVLDWMIGTPKRAPSAPGPLSLDVPKDHRGFGRLRVVVPEDTPSGRYEGRLEVEGNFDAISSPFDLEVVRYEELVDALLAEMDAPESRLSVATVLANAAKKGDKKVSLSIDGVSDGSAIQEEGGWGRWLVAGSGIWDLGALRWLGPITDPTDRGPSYGKALAGPRRDPRLFFLNHGSSIDVISIRERRTVARLTSPNGDVMTSGHFRVSPDGDRILVRCGDHLCFFHRDGDAWGHRIVTSPCPFPTNCAWTEADPDVRDVFVGTGPKELFATSDWQEVVREDLLTGKRTSVALDQVCSKYAYSGTRGLIVGVAQREGDTAIAVVRTRDLSVTRFRMPPTTVDEVSIGDGEIFLRPTRETCLASKLTNPLEPHPCVGDPFARPTLVPGTKIAYETTFNEVTYAR